MLTYFLRRVFQSVIFVFLATFIMFTVLVMLVPDGPSDRYAVAKAQGYTDESYYPNATIADLEEQYKLDKPWPLNFFVWLFDPNDTTVATYDSQYMPVILPKGLDIQIGNLSIRGSGMLTGDFGKQMFDDVPLPVGDIISDRAPNSVFLFVAVLVLTLIIGIPLGLIGALRKGRFLDHVVTVSSLSGISIPPFASSYLLIIFCAIGLKSLHDSTGLAWIPWFPAGGFSTDNIWAQTYHVILPATALAIPQIARVARHTRFALLDVLQKEYIRTARAKGLSLRAVVFKHALRNSLVPIIAQLALFVPLYVSAAAPVENAFAYSGLGRELYIAVGGCQFTTNPVPSDALPQCGYGFSLHVNTSTVLPILFIMMVLVAVSTLIADVLYLVADPRISYSRKGGSG